MAIVTCHTEGCGNAGIPIPLQLTFVDPDTGTPYRVGGVACGVCGQTITDIDEAGPDEPEPEPEPEGTTDA